MRPTTSLQPALALRTLFLIALASAGGCSWSLPDIGIDPKSYQLYFPTGIAMDPAGQYVYVSNGNADLAFGGGTVMMVDMLRFECTVARWRQRNGTRTALPAACNLGDPKVQEARDADARAAQCQADPSDQSIVDCDESQFILQNSTVKIGNFAGEIRLQRFSDETHRRLYVAVRGDPSITWVDVRFPGAIDPTDPDDKFRPTSIDRPGVLQCVDHPASLVSRPGYDAHTNTTSSPVGCDVSHLVQQFVCRNLPSCLGGLNNDGTTELPTEPLGMQLDQGSLPDGSAYVRLLVSHQTSGQVTVIDLGHSAPHILSTSIPLFQPDANGNHGGFSLAQQNKHDPTSLWYVTSNLFPEIDTFRVSEDNIVQRESQLNLQSTFSSGADVRDIRFEPSGNRAFITDNNPPVLLTYDTRVVPGMNSGLPLNQVTSILDVCQTPSHMGSRRLHLPGAPGEPIQLKTRLYVVCFLSDQVMVVDPDQPEVLETIFSGMGGPNEIAFNFGDVDAAPADQITQLLPRRGYVTNFTESTIAVVDLEPGSPTENRVVARLGFPPTGPQP